MDLNAQIGCSKLWPGSSTSEISDKKSMDSIFQWNSMQYSTWFDDVDDRDVLSPRLVSCFCCAAFSLGWLHDLLSSVLEWSGLIFGTNGFISSI